MEVKILTIAISNGRIRMCETATKKITNEETICKVLEWRWRNVLEQRDTALFFFVEGGCSTYVSKGNQFEELKLSYFQEVFNKIIKESGCNYDKVRFTLYSRLETLSLNKEREPQMEVSYN